jgi:PilZ domain
MLGSGRIVRLIGWRKAERRRWKRYAFNSAVRVVTDSAVVEARCIRLSPGGIYLFALADLPSEAEIKIEFTSNAHQKLCPRKGIVRHRAIYLYGVEFLAGEPLDCE